MWVLQTGRLCRTGVVAALLACAVTGAVAAQTPGSGAEQSGSRAALYAQPPAFNDIALAPSGTRFAKIVQRNSLFYIEVWPIGASEPSATYEFGPARAPNWIEWKNEDRLLVSLGIPSERWGFLLNESRLISFKSDLTRPIMLNGGLRERIDPPFQDNILDMRHGDARTILLSINYGRGRGVYQAEVGTGRLTTVRRGNEDVDDWIVGVDGQIAWGVGEVSATQSALYRPRADDWVVDLVPLPGVRPEHVFYPVAVDGDNDRLVVLSNHEGGTTGLYIYSVSQGAFIETLHTDPRYDVSSAVMSPDGKRVVGANSVSDVYHTVYVDEAAAARSAAVARLIGVEGVEIYEETPDGRYLIAGAAGDGRLGRTWWVDIQTGQTQVVGEPAPGLATVDAVKATPITYSARDGLEIPGYVTLPSGYTLDSARGLPFVVMPHGGPHARDSAEFDFLAQFVASLGYGVLQPNFRGSAGFGESFRQAGEKEWGGAILNDVEDGARWLISQGYADADKMCVVGWSFGGYLALMSAAEHADLYKCASATAPVTDLIGLIRYNERYYTDGADVMRRMIGNAWRDRSRLISESPLHRVDDFQMPVLLTHGTIDVQVPIDQSDKLHDALKGAGKPVSYIRMPWADHSLTRQNNRQALLDALEPFLVAHLGDRRGAAASPAAPAAP